MEISENKKNQEVSYDTGGSSIGKDIKNLSTIVNPIKSKKSNLTKSKILDKVTKTNFLIFRAKKVFTYLYKIFIKAIILHYFDSKYYICN